MKTTEFRIITSKPNAEEYFRCREMTIKELGCSPKEVLMSFSSEKDAEGFYATLDLRSDGGRKPKTMLIFWHKETPLIISVVDADEEALSGSNNDVVLYKWLMTDERWVSAKEKLQRKIA